MRDSSGWRGQVQSDLHAQGYPESGMNLAEFCEVELGLTFLAEHFPGEPVGALQPILSGYIEVPDDLIPIVRRVRHRMGDTARRGYWRRLLNEYVAVPEEFRLFKRLDATDRRVNDQTGFAPKPSSIATGRPAEYANAMAEVLPYRPSWTYRPAEAGQRYSFRTSRGTEYVNLPGQLPEAQPIAVLEPVTQRTREPWSLELDKDIDGTAAYIDVQLAGKPGIRNRNFRSWVHDHLRFSAVIPGQADLDDQPATISIDGVEHWVGLMNSGKTRLTDMIIVNRVREGHRVGVVVGSVGDVYAKVSFLRALGISAVPLIGKSSRKEHAARYWASHVEESASLFPEPDAATDPAAAFANASCLLEPLRQGSSPHWEPLSPDDFPCRGKLQETGVDRPRHFDCPLLSVCPAQKALREIASAEVWVTTPQCLVASRAEPSSASMRWAEAFQHHLDLLVIDEADAVQQVFDSKFVQTEQLVAADNGWSHRMAGYTYDGLATASMAPVVDVKVQEWHEYLQIHHQAVFALNRLALSQEGNRLKEHLGESTFTAHSLLRHVSRSLYGLSPASEGDKETEDAAEKFYQSNLQAFAEAPLVDGSHILSPVTDELYRSRRDDEAVVRELDRWINTHFSQKHTSLERINFERALLRLLIEAAVWSSRITTTFFRMVTRYQAVRESLNLPDDETFMLDKPPLDYRPLVPEAPMGNLLALRWAANGSGGASLQILWVHGVGRWLLHHLHDLLASEGIDGPHVILTSATSWIPGSSFYDIPIVPAAVLRQPDADHKALMTSSLTVQPGRTPAGEPIFVSGRNGSRRNDALRQMVTYLCEILPGRRRSVIDELRSQLQPDRQKILLVTLSGKDARLVAEHVNNRTSLTARYVVPDAAGPQQDGILRRLVASFGTSEHDLLVAAELSIQRGYNILNRNDTAAIGAVIYLTRSHPPPFDLGFPLSLVSQLAMRHLQTPIQADPGQIAVVARQLRGTARNMWFDLIGQPVIFRTLHKAYLPAFVANNLVPMSQTIGRSIRGNQPTRVLLCDAAFAERLANNEKVPDTQRTSLVVATDAFLAGLLRAPESDDAEERQLHAINKAVWGLMGHLICGGEPLGSHRKAQ